MARRRATYARGHDRDFRAGPRGQEDRHAGPLGPRPQRRGRGAAVRDETGRTYVAGTVALESLQLSALQTAVAMAVASGAKSLEAAAVVSAADEPAAADLAAVRDLGGAGTPVLLAGPDGTLKLAAEAR
ncbi:cytidine deaminase [Kitasatospora cheerisanensis KCTC 2395]|uniref:Cytidine deaminase n=1 Tax=Kitasatospora cheerisanensis KCTC 2395 TaxID=1348663 RepID=A0A066YV88_9ACTN|nr:cytidine deaminase [Kitasatospora cheerisanensis KCTC 2395]